MHTAHRDVRYSHSQTICFGNFLRAEAVEGRQSQDILSLVLKPKTGPGVYIVLIRRVKAGIEL